MSNATEQIVAGEKLMCQIALSFHPSYSHRQFGADYGRRYHYDPIFRIETDQMVVKGLYRIFGEYGMGDPDPTPALGVSIQPLDFMNAALGGRMNFKEDASVETPDKPLSEIETISDVQELQDIDWHKNALLQDFFSQVEQMTHTYPTIPITHVQGIWQEGALGQNSFLTMHTPYTTAFRLVGQNILEIMLIEDQLAVTIFEWLMRQYESLWNTICKRMGWRGTKVHFGDCAATMLSPKMYEHLCLPLYQKLMQNYDAAVIHSCGQSTHLLEHFAQIPKVSQLQLGYGTNLSRARQLFPKSSIIAYYDPGRLITDSPQDIADHLWQMAEQLKTNFQISCGGVDPNTPPQNIYTYLEIGKSIQKTFI